MTTTAAPRTAAPALPPPDRSGPAAPARRSPLDGREPAEPPPGRRRAGPRGRRAGGARPAHSGAGGLVVTDPGELTAAVPALLGFHPRDSLVLLAISGTAADRRIGLTLRVDLPSRSRPRAELVELARDLVGTLLLDEPHAVAALVFAPDRGADLPHRSLVDAVADAVGTRGMELLSAVWAEGTAEGARWACYGPCGCTGAVPDAAATPLAARNVFEGRVVHSSRDDMARVLDPVDPAAIRRREEILDDGAGSADVLDVPAEAPEEVLAVVDTAIADTAEGVLVLDDARVVALARALSTTPVRDGALLRCLGPAAAAAEQLWAALVREVPEPEVAEPAVLLAACALLRGDGALANIAIERAERAWPGHRLAGLLRVLAVSAVPPSRVRELLGDSLVGVPGPRRPVRRAGGGSARRSTRRRPSC